MVAGILQRDKLTHYLLIIWQDYVFRTLIDLIKENGITLKLQKADDNLAETITDTNYANDIALLANSPTQVKSQLHSLEQAAGDISLHEL